MKHRLLSMIISVALILSLSACSSSSTSDTGKEQKQEDFSSSSKLTVLNCAANPINKTEFYVKCPDIQVEEEIYEDITTLEVKKQIMTKIMAGEGPDIFIVDVEDFSNIHKMFQSGLFYDLDALIKDDKSFKMEEYNKVAMDSGIVNGKRYVIPIFFGKAFIYTSKSFLSKSGINISEEGVSWTGLSDIVKKFISNNKKKDKYLFGPDFSFDRLIKDSCMKFIDFTKKESNFDSEEFISLLNLFKDIQTTVCPTEVAAKSDAINLMKNGTYGICLDHSDLMDQQSWSSFYKEYLGEETYMIPFLVDNQTADITAEVRLVAGVNANCKKPKEAFEFLKVLLSKDNQIPYKSHSAYVNFPVNIEAYKEELKYRGSEDSITAVGMGLYEGSEYSFLVEPLSKEMCDKSDKLYNGMAKTQILDYNVFTIFSEETKAFLSGKATAEQTAKVINDKVMLYLNE